MCANLAHRYGQVAMPSVMTKECDDDFKLPQCSFFLHNSGPPTNG
jgi:hypothetical protein